ncbi:MAG: VWA domain-containing protein [Hamadaea sp.]|uniref:VWA domain-containing protein n=1 Tax=Hamadaea sp. TaxID=2024425 RepID=UPI0017B05F9B|nr:VWA domain-containing protein [Hamadaea sp.]NUR71213.1 VWA domain-containing protein [Hamadaea sp.]NUT17744.1 VWA domain-containing protein [Hamadaea sp.]
MRRLALVAIGLTAVLTLLTAGPAYADPRLSASSVRQEAGLVEFYLTGSDLPSGNALSQGTLSAKVDGQTVPLTAAAVGQSQGRALRRAVALVIDTSGSMSGEPLSSAKSAAASFLTALPADIQVGVVTAGSPAIVVARATPDRARVRSAVAGLQAKGETSLYDAVRAAADVLSGQLDEKRIVVLSDGADTASSVGYEDARKAAGSIPVDTIAFKTQEATAAVLANLSQATGGKAYRAGDPQALTGVFTQAAGAFSAQLLVRVTIPPELQGKDGTLVISARAGSATVTTDMKMSFVPDTRKSTPLVGKRSTGIPDWLLYSLLGTIFLGLLIAGVLIIGPLLTADARRHRFAQIDQFSPKSRPAPPPPPIEADTAIAQTALQLSQQVMRQTKVEGRLARQIELASLRMLPHEWLLLRLTAVAVGALVFFVLFSPWWLGVVLGALVGWGATAVFHRVRAGRRASAFAAALPDALQLVIGSLRSGFSLAQSVEAMTHEIGGSMQIEFGRALGEVRLGAEIEDALDRVAQRMHNKDLSFAVVAIKVQREVGGNLAEILSTTVATMRERATLQRQVKALSAEGRLSAYVLIGLPFIVLAYMLVVKASYLLPLVQTPAGIAMSIGGAVLLGLGVAWLLKVVKVEV